MKIRLRDTLGVASLCLSDAWTVELIDYKLQ